MTLAALELPTAEIKVRNTQLVVRGLAFVDVAALIQQHRNELDRLVGLFTAKVGEKPGTQDLIKVLLAEMPALAAAIIAHGCDEPQQASKAARLPIAVQTEAILAIGRLTFEEAGGVKKFAEQLVALFGASTETIRGLLSSNSTLDQQSQ